MTVDPSADLVDVHAHVLPDWYVAAAKAAGHATPDGMPGWPSWSVGDHLDLMDRVGVGVSVLSISSPGVHFGDDASAADLAVEVNDFMAHLSADHPDRFEFFAALPLLHAGRRRRPAGPKARHRLANCRSRFVAAADRREHAGTVMGAATA